MLLKRLSLFLNLYDCLEEIRQRGRFAGFSLHVSVNEYIPGSKLCYKNVSRIPPLNFTTICRTYGRYIIYYNERLNGVTYPSLYEIYNVYTELCEVIVKGNIYYIIWFVHSIALWVLYTLFILKNFMIYKLFWFFIVNFVTNLSKNRSNEQTTSSLKILNHKIYKL